MRKIKVTYFNGKTEVLSVPGRLLVKDLKLAGKAKQLEFLK